MERNVPDSRPLHQPSRSTSSLVVTSTSKRRSLFSRSQPADENAPVPTASPASGGSGNGSGTKIPRPAGQRPSQSRSPFSLSAALRMAEEEEAIQGSPSPAPRSWRSRRESSNRRSWGIGNQANESDRNAVELRKENSNGSTESLKPRRSDISDSDFDEKLRQHGIDQAGSGEPRPRSSGSSLRATIGNRISETGNRLVRKGSRGSIDSQNSPRSVKNSPGGWFGRRFSSIRREASNASSTHEPGVRVRDDIEQSSRPGVDPPLRPATVPPDHRSPEKSFTWQADDDFTAGDLQFSNSPPIHIGRSNTKLDEIRLLEAQAEDDERPASRNTRIDEIRALEIEAALKYPDESPEPSSGDANSGRATRTNSESEPVQSQPASKPSARMDELRAREIERLSKRALATARLDEIRGRHREQPSRSPSPELPRKTSKEAFRSFSPVGDKVYGRFGGVDAAIEKKQGPVDDDQIPAVRVSATRTTSSGGEDNAPKNQGGVNPTRSNSNATSQVQDEARDMLRRLAIAAGTSPVFEPLASKRGSGATKERPTDGAKSDRPTVGFAGLRRDSSVESRRSSKRSSAVHSETDPTDRIEGEMKLFAPLENQSERGSLRAPSPVSDEDMPEETPRPPKPDPLTMPTPRVTGAYVDTPVTVKVEKIEDRPVTTVETSVPAGTEQDKGDGDKTSAGDMKPAVPVSSRDSSASRGRRESNASQQLRSANSSRADRASSRSSSIPARRRARSLQRVRPPLTNSAKPPTVLDDLREIQKANQIEDSTLDDLAELLAAQKETKEPVEETRKMKSERESASRIDREKELEAYDRMNRSLKTGLLGIRTAKQGIERLEDKVFHADTKDHLPSTTKDSTASKDATATKESPSTTTKESPSTTTKDNHKGSSPGATTNGAVPHSCPACRKKKPASSSVMYIHLPVPRLWYHRPHFKFTLLGLGLFLLSFWYIAETWMCFRYCKPQYCYPGMNCEWSPDDPVWGYAIPVKLDEWLAGGHGRALVHRLEPEVADLVADMWDSITGTDILSVDTSSLGWEQRHQYLRRLRKKGLIKPFVESAEDREMFDSWDNARASRERVDAAREMGYLVEDDGLLVDDERV